MADSGRKRLYRHLDNFQTDEAILLAESAARKILPFIQRGIANHTAHDVNHSEHVIEFLNRLVDIANMHEELSQTEIRLLYLAAWLHDIGNLRKCGRRNHSRESCRMIEELDERYLKLGSMREPLKFIIKYHQSHLNLSEVPRKESRISGDRIRLRLLCAIFRLADACHMGPDRASEVVYSLLKTDKEFAKGKKYWDGNRAIASVDFDLGQSAIVIHVFSKRNSRFIVKDFKEEFDRVGKYLRDYIPIDRIRVIVIPECDIDDRQSALRHRRVVR